MPPPTFDEIKGFIAPSEGNIAHMYVDTKGYVTVGIGNLLSDAAAAVALPFVNRTTKNAATTAEIEADFAEVAKQPKAQVARRYRPFTKLDLPDTQINLLFQKRIEDFQRQLRKSYPSYDTYPSAIQLALIDMAFQLGAGGLKSKWPKLNEAIDGEDWAAAAKNCMRPDANAIRNDGTKALFERAAKEKAAAEAAKKP
jgi:GH24 family phage-related lysozyme (muramidase)